MSLPSEEYCSQSLLGALTAIEIFLNHFSVVDCFQKFPELARKIFRGHSRPFFLRWLNWISSAFNLFSGGRYNAQGLTDVLQDVVGPDRRIFDIPKASPVGCRVAVVASRTEDGKACVIANYRGAGQRDPDVAYQFWIPGGELENPFLWQV